MSRSFGLSCERRSERNRDRVLLVNSQHVSATTKRAATRPDQRVQTDERARCDRGAKFRACRGADSRGVAIAYSPLVAPLGLVVYLCAHTRPAPVVCSRPLPSRHRPSSRHLRASPRFCCRYTPLPPTSKHPRLSNKTRKNGTSNHIAMG